MMEPALARSPDADNVGINVIGHVAGNLGVGVATRQLIELIEGLGHPVAAFDVDRGTRRARSETRFDRLTVASAAELPFKINLFVLGLGAIDWALTKCPDHFFDGSYMNAIICFWELPVVSAARLAQLDQFDVVVGASDFLGHVFRQSLTTAKVLVGHLPVRVPEPVPFDRKSIGIPDGATAFCFSFDPASDVQRKNPGSIVSAFLKGVSEEQDAWLVLRINNPKDLDGREQPIVAMLQAQARTHSRIVLITEPLSYPQVLGLYQACDVYVSLHRAEGLGLGMAEAMTLGTPVIATGWSGNMTFMRETNACLVRYQLVPVETSAPAYNERDMVGAAAWAEPDVAHAASLMRYLHGQREIRLSLGKAATSAMRAFDEEAMRSEFIKEIFVLASRRESLAQLGYAPRRSGSGRPRLDLPVEPWLERSIGSVRDFTTRVRRKLARTLGARPPDDVSRTN